MKLNNTEVNHIGTLWNSVKNKWDKNTTITLQRYAIRDMVDLIYVQYLKNVKHENEVVLKYVEHDNGVVKYKAKILNLQGKENNDNEPLWLEGGEEKFNKEMSEYYKKENEFEIKKYPIQQLLDTPIKMTDEDIYSLLRYIAE